MKINDGSDKFQKKFKFKKSSKLGSHKYIEFDFCITNFAECRQALAIELGRSCFAKLI